MTVWPMPPKPRVGEADEQPQEREAPLHVVSVPCSLWVAGGLKLKP